MKVLCPTCGEAVKGDGLDLASKIAVCKPCGEVIPFPSAPRAALVRPSDLKLEVVESESATSVLIPPTGATRGRALFMLLFAAVWNGFLVVWYAMALNTGGGPGSMMFWFPLIHVAAGIFVLYAGIRDLLNRVRVHIDAQRFELRHGPIPTGRNVAAGLSTVESFAPLAEKSRGRNDGEVQTTWHVQLITTDGTSTQLYLGLPSEEHARYLAARLEEQVARLRPVARYR